LFNAMSGFHHREPGVSGAAMAHAQYSEIIPDLLHVHPGAIKAALRAIPQLYCVTDATSSTGMPDGDYKLGRQTVRKCSGGVRLKDGTLAGSCLTTHQAFQNLLKIGLSVQEASARLSEIPCQLIQENDKGLLIKDFEADILIFDSVEKLSATYVGGACQWKL
jgi:N-acetylglucosamine-6-phosphate deacetylase